MFKSPLSLKHWILKEIIRLHPANKKPLTKILKKMEKERRKQYEQEQV